MKISQKNCTNFVILFNLNFFSKKFSPRILSNSRDVNEIKNYDLSLYPIPRAESVSEDLREIQRYRCRSKNKRCRT